MSKQDELLAPAPSGACAPMTDAEVICSWMEPKPTVTMRQWRAEHPEGWDGHRQHPRWWVWVGDDYDTGEWVAFEMRLRSLDSLREVEQRLIRDWWETQTLAACARMVNYKYGLIEATRGMCEEWHASAEQKIKALAAVLRPLVTGARAGAVEPTSPSVEGRA